MYRISKLLIYSRDRGRGRGRDKNKNKIPTPNKIGLLTNI
jgi:hypothetical protein